jgi:hypothetical protein
VIDTGPSLSQGKIREEKKAKRKVNTALSKKLYNERPSRKIADWRRNNTQITILSLTPFYFPNPVFRKCQGSTNLLLYLIFQRLHPL